LSLPAPARVRQRPKPASVTVQPAKPHVIPD